MMSKRPDLSALVEAGGGRRGREAFEQPPPLPTPENPAAKAQKSREGTVPITVMQPEPVRIQLKMIAVENGMTMENLMGEGINGIFAKYGKPEIAVVKKRKGRAA
jgi:hypothetical protein